MAKHALPEAAYESRIGHVQRGVGKLAWHQWLNRIGARSSHSEVTSHSACDCESYQRHDSLRCQPPGWNLDRCSRPLATIHVDRQRADEMAARALMERCPWLSYHDAKTLARWKPGDPVPITGAR